MNQTTQTSAPEITEKEPVLPDRSEVYSFLGPDAGTAKLGFKQVTIYPKGSSSDEPKSVSEIIRKRIYHSLQNSTLREEPDEGIRESLETLFARAVDEVFEDGMDSEFSRELINLVKLYGEPAVDIIASLITFEQVNAEVASEALRWLARMDDPGTYYSRRWLLERCLSSASLWVRDGAILGLNSLNDRHAVPYLREAVSRERCGELRKDIKDIEEMLQHLGD